jgi:putative FmdB family regulatory protein
MPLYEYRCEKCGFRLERIERPSAAKNGSCPECGGVTHRLIGVPALQFKGSGWYVNDYGKGNGSRPTESEKPVPAAKPTTTSEKKTEPTPKKSEAQVA